MSGSRPGTRGMTSHGARSLGERRHIIPAPPAAGSRGTVQRTGHGARPQGAWRARRQQLRQLVPHLRTCRGDPGTPLHPACRDRLPRAACPGLALHGRSGTLAANQQTNPPPIEIGHPGPRTEPPAVQQVGPDSAHMRRSGGAMVMSPGRGAGPGADIRRKKYAAANCPRDGGVAPGVPRRLSSTPVFQVPMLKPPSP